MKITLLMWLMSDLLVPSVVQIERFDSVALCRQYAEGRQAAALKWEQESYRAYHCTYEHQFTKEE